MEARGGAIVLIGFMGTGKSSVGRVLEQQTGWQRYDTDELIAAAAGMAITDIFDLHGEEEFRRRETEVLRNLPATDAVIVTGGGAVLRDENVAILHRLGTIANLTADLETLFERVARRNTRPLLRSDDPRRTLAELLRVREPLYRAAADFEVDTSALTHDEVAAAVLARINSHHQNAS
jgi:shikimate kinase